VSGVIIKSVSGVEEFFALKNLWPGSDESDIVKLVYISLNLAFVIRLRTSYIYTLTVTS